LVERIEPFGAFGHVYDADTVEAMRPRVMGTNGVVATGHYLATLAAMEALREGGNAFDAGVSSAMALKALKMGYAGWTGVAPLILYSARDGEVVTRVGAGTTPRKATLAHFLEHGKTDVNMALLPADVDVWLATLAHYGSFSFERASRWVLEVADEGYHLYKHQKGLLDLQQEGIVRYPYNRTFWFPNGVGNQALGDRMRNPDLGKLVRYMIAAERDTVDRGGNREEGIRAARDAFYKGDPARATGEFFAGLEGGLVTYDDLADYQGKWAAPLHTSYRGYDIYVCDGWSQGPRLILFLNLLENFDLESLGYNTPGYIHVLSQAIELGMADSHKYVGDPDFAKTPKALYSKEYARTRVSLVDPGRAFPDMPAWGDPVAMRAIATDSPTSFAATAPISSTRTAPLEDTTSLNVMDKDGNVFSMTESDGQMLAPMIPGWGFGLGRRMEQLNLNANLANVMAPMKRPRNTNNPILIMKNGRPFLGMSTPGGDQQVQAMLQVFLNIVVWGMPPEVAIDQPRFGSYNFPGTGHEINENPGVLRLEARIPQSTFTALAEKGHRVESWGLWNWRTGAITLTYRDPETGLLVAAADVRREAVALGF
jgi:gamma-glutamyltranspeptidase/glutathione hydrolase